VVDVRPSVRPCVWPPSLLPGVGDSIVCWIFIQLWAGILYRCCTVRVIFVEIDSVTVILQWRVSAVLFCRSLFDCLAVSVNSVCLISAQCGWEIFSFVEIDTAKFKHYLVRKLNLDRTLYIFLPNRIKIYWLFVSFGKIGAAETTKCFGASVNSSPYIPQLLSHFGGIHYEKSAGTNVELLGASCNSAVSKLE
jgi:hypothetical protein